MGASVVAYAAGGIVVLLVIALVIALGVAIARRRSRDRPRGVTGSLRGRSATW
jgi:hypothetical protein